MNALVSGKQRRGGQQGFTLPEILLALVLSAFIIVGGGEVFRQMITVSAENSNQTGAVLQVQYAGFWVSQDGIQAQEVVLGDPATGFPLTLSWKEWESGDEHEVIYTTQPVSDELWGELWELKREHKLNDISQGTILVAEFLDPATTKCIWGGNVLVFEVTAKVDRQDASRTYDIQPRPLQ